MQAGSLVAALRAFAAALVIVSLTMGAADPARAQPPAPGTTGAVASAPELQELVATIEDEAKRNELLASLRALIAAQAQVEKEPPTLSAQLLALAHEWWQASGEAAEGLAGELQGVPVWLDSVEAALADPQRLDRGVRLVAAFLGIFLAGWTFEYFAWRLLIGSRHRLEAAGDTAAWQRLWRASLRVVIDLLPVAVFALAAYLAALVIAPPPAVQAMALNFVNAYVLARGLMAFVRMMLSPRAPRLRPLPLSDAAAADLFVWFGRFVRVGVGGYFVIAAIVLLGVPRRSTAVLTEALYLLLAILAIAMVVHYQPAVSAWLRRQAAGRRLWAAGPVLEALALTWPALAILYIIAFFAISAFDIEGGFRYMGKGTLATVAAVGLTAVAVSLLRPEDTTDAVLPDVEAAESSGRLQQYLPLLRWAVVALALAAGLVVALEGWGIGAWKWLTGGGGQRLIGSTASIALAVTIAVVAWELASGAIARYMSRSAGGAAPRLTSARARTLLPLLRKTLFVLLCIMVVLITLSELGINIAPLLAGAGVAGLAIGFGAQKLVQDVITGFFLLVEDALAVGDVVSVAGASGVVEDLSVRALKLRDVAGSVHTVPFSSVGTVVNMTKSFSYYVLDIGVNYGEDTDRVGDVCRDIVEGMRRDPAFSTAILAPLEVMGLETFTPSAIILRARIKTLPMKQWEVGREFNRRMKLRFEAVGISFPLPVQTIVFGTPDASMAPPRAGAQDAAGAGDVSRPAGGVATR
jgi:small conductance mechanosensitive channel